MYFKTFVKVDNIRHINEFSTKPSCSTNYFEINNIFRLTTIPRRLINMNILPQEPAHSKKEIHTFS